MGGGRVYTDTTDRPGTSSLYTADVSGRGRPASPSPHPVCSNLFTPVRACSCYSESIAEHFPHICGYGHPARPRGALPFCPAPIMTRLLIRNSESPGHAG